MNVTACEAANELARLEHPEFAARHYLTKAVLCDVQPACATETLFSHEFSWLPAQLRRPSTQSAWISRCRTWRDDAEWPAREPHLSRASVYPRARSFWEVLQLLPNRTVWMHGDSIQLPPSASLQFIQNNQHLLLLEPSFNINTTLHNLSLDALLKAQPELVN